MKICLDFDRVLHDVDHPVPGRRMGAPMDGALGAILLLLDAGHEVFIHSARVTAEAQFGHVVQWLEFYGFPGLPIHVQKPVADVYVDDKAIRHIDWATTLAALEGAGNDSGPKRTGEARSDRARPSSRGGNRRPGARLPSTGFGGPDNG